MNAVELNKLTVKFGAFTAVNELSLSVAQGEIFGFLGANGAGKTTAIRVMCGLLLPTSGEVRIAGLDLARGMAAIKRKVGYMSQKFTLYDDLTVLENLAFKAALRKIPDNTAKERIDRIFAFIGYDDARDVMVRDLPAGVKQQISLAATLIHDPEIVFLDEPTSGVSPAVRAMFWSLIRSLAKDGKTVFVTTHYMDEAEQCGRIALLRAGSLIALGSPDALEEKAYPDGIVEILFSDKGRPEAGRIASDPSIVKLWPFGLKYHAELRKGAELRLPPGFTARKIKPSLEDVFMKLVEGDDR
jgi:ABC-2 type transport system ATP-binding protein